jgi:hypothetical protein
MTSKLLQTSNESVFAALELRHCSFEKNVNVDFLHDCHSFLKEKHIEIWEHMNNTNKTVGNLFLRLNTRYARDEVPLTAGAEVLSECLRQPAIETSLYDLERRNTREEHHSDSPLSALAAAAALASAAAPEGNQRGTQDEQQLRARNEGFIAEQVPGLAPTEVGPALAATYGQSMQSPWQMHADQRSAAMSGASTSSCMPSATTGQAQAHEPGSTSGNSQHRLAVDTQARGQSLPGAWNEGLTLGQVPRLASNEMESVAAATYGRVPPSLWTTYAYQNCPQQVPVDPFPPGGAQNLMASEVPLDDTFRLSQTHLDQSDMAIRQDGGGFWPEAWLDDLAQAGGFST